MDRVHSFTPNQVKSIEQWIEWLETTDLPQGDSNLKAFVMEDEWIYDENEKRNLWAGEKSTGVAEYCCLGLYIENRDPEYFTEMKEDGVVNCPYKKGDTSSVFRNVGYLPFTLSRELGLYSFNNAANFGEPRKNNLQEELSWMNDDLDYSFKTIANELRYLLEKGRWMPETEEAMIPKRRHKLYYER